MWPSEHQPALLDVYRRLFHAHLPRRLAQLGECQARTLGNVLPSTHGGPSRADAHLRNGPIRSLGRSSLTAHHCSDRKRCRRTQQVDHGR